MDTECHQEDLPGAKGTDDKEKSRESMVFVHPNDNDFFDVHNLKELGRLKNFETEKKTKTNIIRWLVGCVLWHINL